MTEPTDTPTSPDTDEPGATFFRRTLLGAMSVSAIFSLTAGVLGLTGKAASGRDTTASPTVPATHTAEHTAVAAASPSASPSMDHDAFAEAAVKAFPAKTAGYGLEELKSTVVGGVREFDLTCDPVRWEVTPGQFIDAVSYNKQIPGPIIRITEGEKVRIRVKNNLNETTGTHWHGMKLTNKMDGVPFLTQPVIKPGETFTYEFTAKPVGSHMYHSHHNATDQVGRGLLGAFIVHPRDPRERADRKYGVSQDIVWISNDSLGGFTINGRGFPATAPIVAGLGDKILVRFMNEGVMMHPWHLHGMPMHVVARDGYELGPASFRCDTLGVNPGERWDVVIDCTEPGAWAFHCHILPHAEGRDGMFGMVTALVVQDAAARAAASTAPGSPTRAAAAAAGSTALECRIL